MALGLLSVYEALLLSVGETEFASKFLSHKLTVVTECLLALSQS